MKPSCFSNGEEVCDGLSLTKVWILNIFHVFAGVCGGQIMCMIGVFCCWRMGSMSALSGEVEVWVEVAGTPGCPPCVYLGQATPPEQTRPLWTRACDPSKTRHSGWTGGRTPLNRSSVGEGGADMPWLTAEC